MKTLILPGFSLRNKKWASELNDYLGGSAIVHEWKHWQTGNNEDFDFYKEAEIVAQKIGDEDIQVIAHSLGTLITVFLMSKNATPFKKVILNGMPLDSFDQESIDVCTNVFTNYPAEQILFFQNSQDPHGTFDNLKQFVHSINPKYTIIEKESDTHDYFYFEEFMSFLEN